MGILKRNAIGMDHFLPAILIAGIWKLAGFENAVSMADNHRIVIAQNLDSHCF